MKNSPLRCPELALSLGAILLLAPLSQASEALPKLSPVERKFIQDEAKAGEVIFTMASEAASRGESKDVRSFARSLISDHEKAIAELSELATAKEVDLAPRSAALTDREGSLSSIRKLKDEAFDREFLSLMIEMHTDSVENFEKTTTDSPDIDLKRWAGEKLPILKAHLDQATKLSSLKTAGGRKPNLIIL